MTLAVVLWVVAVAIVVGSVVFTIMHWRHRSRAWQEARENEARLQRLARDESARRIAALDYRDRFLERRNGQ